MPNSMIPSGIHAIGAIGASPRTRGITMSANAPDAEIRMPVAMAAAKPMASPTSTRNALTTIATGIGMASPPKPTRKSLSSA